MILIDEGAEGVVCQQTLAQHDHSNTRKVSHLPPCRGHTPAASSASNSWCTRWLEPRSRIPRLKGKNSQCHVIIVTHTVLQKIARVGTSEGAISVDLGMALLFTTH